MAVIMAKLTTPGAGGVFSVFGERCDRSVWGQRAQVVAATKRSTPPSIPACCVELSIKRLHVERWDAPRLVEERRGG